MPSVSATWRVLAFLLLAACSAAAAADGYTIRLFWAHAPNAVEIAPIQPFSARTSPLLQFSDGRQVMLRAPLRVTAEGAELRLGGRFPNRVHALQSDSPLRLRVAGGDWAEFSGALRVWAADDELHAEIHLETEAYVRAVLAGEAGGVRDIEALKAVAVAIRSYAFATNARHVDEGFTFCDTTHCQDLRLAARHPLLDEAVAETEGQLLWRDGSAVVAWHHADSGGHTEDARAVWGKDAPAWMRGQPDPHSLQPQPFRWNARIPIQDLARALRAEGIGVADREPPVVSTRHASGRAATIAMGGRSFPASALRFALGRQLGWNLVRSDLYEIAFEGGHVVFEGRGAGHGVGLSQRGAAIMARAGKSYREVLDFYFPGAKVGLNAQDLRWTRRGGGLLQIWYAGPVDEGFAAMASRELRRMEEATGISLRRTLEIRVYADLDSFRNHTGNPGWVAAGTTSGARADRIVLQPLAILRRSNQLESLIRHEFVHVLAMQEATRPLPRWFQEGLGRWLAREGSVTATHPSVAGSAVHFLTMRDLDEGLVHAEGARRHAAASLAERIVRASVARYGRDEVLGWVRRGPPDDDHILLRELQHAR